MKSLEIKCSIPEAYDFLFEPHRYKVAWGGRGAARSWSFARALLIMAIKRPMRILCAREFQKSIRDSVHKLLADQIDLLGLDPFYQILKTEIRGPGGSEFIFEGLHANVRQIRSLEGCDFVWVEEAEKVSDESWRLLIPTIRKDGSEIGVTFNADEEADPTYRRFILSPPPDGHIIKTSWEDNPFFPEVLRKEKDYLYSVDPDAAANVWGGECREHSDAQILKGKWRVESFEPENDWLGPYYGADWGMVDPNVLVRFWLKPEGSLMIEYESWTLGVDPGEALAAEWVSIPNSKENVIRADNARPETISLMCKEGFRVRAAPKWKGSVEDGIGWLRSRPEIVIHPRCRHAIDEAKAWVRKVDKLTGDVREEIADGHDHIYDAIRYGATPMIKNKGSLSAGLSLPDTKQASYWGG